MKRLGQDFCCNYHLFFYAIYILICIFLFWKCKFGIANTDESFYLTIPYRLWQGDSLLLHEWHRSQMFGFLLYPILKVYLSVFQSTEAILLNFRYIFTCVWCLSALFFYNQLKMFSKVGAMISSISFLLYAPFGIMALSYNSMGILLLLIAGTLMITAKENHSRFKYILAGSCMAGAVLCCPFLILLYAMFSLYSLRSTIYKKDLDQKRIWLFVSHGIVLVFFAFGAFVLSKASFSELLQVLPYILQDPEHSAIDVITSTKKYLFSIFYCNPISNYYIIFFILLLYFGCYKRKRLLGFAGVCGIVLVLQIVFLINKPYINFFMFFPCLLGFYCCLTSKDRAIHQIFKFIWIPGLVYTYCINLSSNQQFYAISSAATLMTIASLLIVVLYTKKVLLKCAKPGKKKIIILSVCLLFLLQISIQFYMRFVSVFWETGIKSQTELIMLGPEKGLLVSNNALLPYDNFYKDIALIRKHKDINQVLYLSTNTWMYLCSDKKFATYSAWLSGVNPASLIKLDQYFSMFPSKTPDTIYIESCNKKYIDYYQTKGYIVNRTNAGNYILTLKAL